jgi:hypothetical protein
MCEISKISDDWITKGCHVHVGPIELALRPDHRGGILIKKFFQSTSDKDADAAVRKFRDWLEDEDNRRTLYRDIDRARRFVLGDWGLLTDLAHGRGKEFTFLLVALKKLGI